MKQERRRAYRTGAGHCSGFTLLEVIVAFALLAAALTMLLGSLSSAARQVRKSSEISRASLYAQSLLAQIGVGEVLEPGRKEGWFELERYHWTLDVVPYVESMDPSVAPGGPASQQLLQVTLEVRWGDEPGQTMHWKTVRLVSVEEHR